MKKIEKKKEGEGKVHQLRSKGWGGGGTISADNQ